MPNGEWEYIRTHWRKLRELPPPDETFFLEDQTEFVKHNHQKLKREGVIEPVHRRGDEVGGEQVTRIHWSVPEETHELIRDLQDANKDASTNPCGHRLNFHNKPDEDAVECKECGESWSKSEYRALTGIGSGGAGGGASAD